jgi:hypothetical protein
VLPQLARTISGTAKYNLFNWLAATQLFELTSAQLRAYRDRDCNEEAIRPDSHRMTGLSGSRLPQSWPFGKPKAWLRG